jgi:hypothetical protein
MLDAIEVLYLIMPDDRITGSGRAMLPELNPEELVEDFTSDLNLAVAQLGADETHVLTFRHHEVRDEAAQQLTVGEVDVVQLPLDEDRDLFIVVFHGSALKLLPLVSCEDELRLGAQRGFADLQRHELSHDCSLEVDDDRDELLARGVGTLPMYDQSVNFQLEVVAVELAQDIFFDGDRDQFVDNPEPLNLLSDITEAIVSGVDFERQASNTSSVHGCDPSS